MCFGFGLCACVDFGRTFVCVRINLLFFAEAGVAVAQLAQPWSVTLRTSPQSENINARDESLIDLGGIKKTRVC